MSTSILMEPFDPLSPSRTAHLLGLALSQRERPIDRVIARLREPDGATWVEQAIETVGREMSMPLRAMLLDGAPLEQLRIAKESVKRQSKTAEAEQKMAGTLAYFLLIATAMARHGKIISAQPTAQVRAVLVGLADCVPTQYATDVRESLHSQCNRIDEEIAQ